MDPKQQEVSATPAVSIPEEIRKQAALIPRPVAVKYTVDGEVIVMGAAHPDDPKKMLVRDLPLSVVESSILPANWQTRHDFIMGVVFEACSQIKQMKNRKVPLTRKELIAFGVQKDEIARLVKWGLLSEKPITLQKDGSNAQTTVSIVYFTPKGRAYIRKSIDPSYGLERKQNGVNESAIRGAEGGQPEGEGTPSDRGPEGDSGAVQSGS